MSTSTQFAPGRAWSDVVMVDQPVERTCAVLLDGRAVCDTSDDLAPELDVVYIDETVIIGADGTVLQIDVDDDGSMHTSSIGVAVTERDPYACIFWIAPKWCVNPSPS